MYVEMDRIQKKKKHEYGKMYQETIQKEDGDAQEEADKPEEEEEILPLSKKQKRKLNRLSVAALKQLVARPDVIEVMIWFGLKKYTGY